MTTMVIDRPTTTTTAPVATAVAPVEVSAVGPKRSWRLRGFKKLSLTEAKVWSRDPAAVFFGLFFPTVLLVGITLLNPELAEPLSGLAGTPYEGVTGVQMFLPPMIAMAMATAALTILPATLAGFREKGVLRRFSATPMRPAGLIAAHYLINLVVSLVATGLAIAVGHLAWGLRAPNNAFVVTLAFVLGLAALFAIGTLVASRAAKASVASAIGSLVYFPMLILAGVFFNPGPLMNDTLSTVARFTPLGAAAQAMNIGWFEAGFPWVQMLVMVGWTLVLFPLGIKLFKTK